MIKVQCATFYSPFAKSTEIDVFENKNYQTGEVIEDRYIISNHKPFDKYVRAFDICRISVVDSDYTLDLEKYGFKEFKGLGELRYRYIKTQEDKI